MKHPTDKLYADQSPDTSGPWTLYRDGKEIMTGTERECWNYIHTKHSYSVHWALKYEGYSIAPAGRREVEL